MNGEAESLLLCSRRGVLADTAPAMFSARYASEVATGLGVPEPVQ
jgi:hypothetical protein